MTDHVTLEIGRALIGRVIRSVTITDDRESIILHLGDGALVTLNARGECCSHSWIESLDDPPALLGTVRRVEMLDFGGIMGCSAYREREDPLSVIRGFGLKITTEKGRCTIELRNDSNCEFADGYYGGYFRLASDSRGAPES